MIRDKPEHAPGRRRRVQGRVGLFYGGDVVREAFSDLEKQCFDLGRCEDDTFSLGGRHGDELGSRAG